MTTQDLTYLRQPQSIGPTLWTYRDLIDRLAIFSNSGGVSKVFADWRIAVDEAYRQLAYMRPWRYLFKQCELATVAAYKTGTVAYTQSTRTLTLTGGTWPSWALYGHVKIGTVFFPVESVTDSTHLVLALSANPGADITSGTSYTLYRSSYTLPGDFRKLYDPENISSLWEMEYIKPNSWFALERHIPSSGLGYKWTVMRDQRSIGSYALYFYPYPATAGSVGFIYQAAPRDLRVSGTATIDSVGTVSTSGTGVTGTGTAFAASHVGAVIRFGASVPDGYFGLNPYTDQAIVASVNSATSITLDRSITSNSGGTKYLISDPVDMPATMIDALLARAKWTYLLNRPDDAGKVQLYAQEAQRAFVQACENDAMVLSGYRQAISFDRMQRDVPVP